MCFPRERANPFGHVLTGATTIVTILVTTTNGYSRKSASAMPYIMCWEIFGLCLSCVSTPLVFIYLFIYLPLYTYDMMLITARDSTGRKAGNRKGGRSPGRHFEMEKFADCLPTVNSGDNCQTPRLKLSDTGKPTVHPIRCWNGSKIKNRQSKSSRHTHSGKKRPAAGPLPIDSGCLIIGSPPLGKVCTKCCVNIA